MLIGTGILFKSDINFQITATFGINVKPKAQPEQPTTFKTGIIMPFEASLEGLTLAKSTYSEHLGPTRSVPTSRRS